VDEIAISPEAPFRGSDSLRRKEIWGDLGRSECLTRLRRKALEDSRESAAKCAAQLSLARDSLQIGSPPSELDCLAGRASARLLGSAPQRKVDVPSRAAALERLEALLAQLQPAFSIGAVTDLDGLFRWCRSAVGPSGVGVIARSYALLAGGTDERCSLGLRPPLGPCVWEAFVTLSGLPRDTSRELSKHIASKFEVFGMPACPESC